MWLSTSITKQQTSKKNEDQKKYNLSHFLLTHHSVIHLLKYLFNICHMARTVLQARRYAVNKRPKYKACWENRHYSSTREINIQSWIPTAQEENKPEAATRTCWVGDRQEGGRGLHEWHLEHLDISQGELAKTDAWQWWSHHQLSHSVLLEFCW